MRTPLALSRSTGGLAETVVELHYRRHPEVAERYGEAGRERCLEDARFHLEYLEQAMELDSPELFAEYVRWGRSVLAGRGIPQTDLEHNLDCLAEVLADRLPQTDADRAVAIVRAARAILAAEAVEPPGFLEGDGPLPELARDYLELLLAGRRGEAARRVLDAVDQGVEIADLYLGVFQPVQHEVGRLWQLNRITVAHEHYCTAATQLVMSQLYPKIFAGPRSANGAKMVAACVPGELHEIGLRMVADLLELEGWDTYYVGGNLPASHLLDLLSRERPRLLALSCSLPPHLADARDIIRRVRENPELDGIHVAVGGRAFTTVADPLALGADSFARDAREALELARGLVGPGER